METRTVKITCDICGANIPEGEVKTNWKNSELEIRCKELLFSVHIRPYVVVQKQSYSGDICSSCVEAYTAAIRSVVQTVTKDIRSNWVSK